MPDRSHRPDPDAKTPAGDAVAAPRGALHIPLPAALIGLGLMAAPVGADAASVAVNDHYATPVNTTLAGVNVTANDLLDNVTVGVFQVSDPLHGNVTLGSDGALTYMPDPGYRGADSFRYGLNSGNSIATVFLDVGTVSVPALGPLGLAALSAGLAGLAMSRRRRS